MNGIPLNRLLRIIIKLQAKRQNKQEGTIKETSGYVGPERVSKWPNSVMMIIMMVTSDRTFIYFHCF